MRLLDWLGARDANTPAPRSYEEIRETVEHRDAEHIERLNRVEASLLSLTAEAGLDDLRRRAEQLNGD